MLKVLFAIACVAAALCLLFWIVLPILAAITATLFERFGRVKEAARPEPPPPPPDDATLYGQLVRASMAYATQPYVTTVTEAVGSHLHVTVSDAYGRRIYAEHQRRIGKTLHAVICLYEDGSTRPSATGTTEIPASQVDWPAYMHALAEARRHGPTLSFIDHRGRRHAVRVSKTGVHHA